ncbi:S8 family serine peptidase [Streptomyces sp. NPDC056910]|uniref:S8 family peptidase n=1 Tax=Streptomyces sp. NPDC056910 TaxID=3345964 RepID=UPI0036B5DCAF
MLTLITGDKVAVTTGADGKQAVDIVGATDASKHFQISSGQDGDLYVIPEDALNAVSAQIVDRELFNVTQALKDGYGDAKTDAVPAIVDFRGKESAAGLRQQAEALPGTEDEHTMPRLGLAAVHVDKSTAKRFWRSVKPTAGKARSGSDAMVPGTAGVTKLWYDGRAKATLDQSVPQIGAPEAWAKGYDGKGTKVAILDTGADLNNADIKSRITATQSFVTGEAVQDGHGHGTHVASTIAGSGANSGGKYKGVAPGADLLIGKVLSNAGSGPLSGILEGMNWAVAQDADVVSMSLGARATTPGGDVLTNAVDSLSASSSTLFVIAAGNDGKNGESTLGTPGIADAALTVGAVDKSDALANFSSRGPRLGDMKIKPEITAPGVNIVAARAAGTTMGTPVDANYTSASGTSMATPHVAGAAAILAQRHPDWSGERIKEELTAHSKKSDNYTPYQQGYGRVDIPAALDPALDLSGTGDFGLVEWQKGTYEKETRTVTLHNSTSSAATLDLAAQVKDSSGTALPDGALTVSGPDVTGGKVTVPASGSSEVTVTLDPNGLKAGQFSGYITATGTDGESVHTPVGFVMAVEQHDVTVKFTDRFGKTPGRVQLALHGMNNSTFRNISLVDQGSTTVTLPVGAYSVEGITYTEAPGDPTRTYAIDGFSIPNINVTDQDVTRSVDGANATDFTAKITGEKRPLENASWMTLVSRSDGAGGHNNTLGEAGLINGSDSKIGAVPTEQPATGDLHLFNALTQREPITQLSVTSPERISVPVVTPGFAQRFEGTKGLRLADAGSGTAEDIAAADLKGRAALITVADPRKMDDQVRRAATAGAAAVIAASAAQGPLFNGSLAANQTIPVAIASHDNGEKLRSLLGKGNVSIALKGVLESGYAYHMPFGTSGIPADLTKTVDAADFVKVRSAYHADGVRHQGAETLHSWAPGQPTSFRAAQPLNMGATRDDYQLAGSNLVYQRVVYPSTAYQAYMTGPRTTYTTAGKTYRENWLAAPMHPPMEDPSICAFCRSDVWTRATGTTAGDSNPAHSLVATPPTLTNNWTFYRNGEQIVDQSKLMVPQKAQYRFVQEVTRDKDYPGVTLGGKVRTEWNFTSAAPTTMSVKDCEKYTPKPTFCESLPAVMLGYDIPLDILNQAPASRPYTFTVNAGRPKGWSGSTEMAGAKVSVSYDDGATWENAKIVREDNNSFQASVHHPKLSDTNGYVTLRTEVWDAAGNRTVQTIHRAYSLK